jgi:hypothetical protein
MRKEIVGMKEVGGMEETTKEVLVESLSTAGDGYLP